MSDGKVTSSPKRNNGAFTTCDYSLAILKKFNSDARVTGVVRRKQSTLVKLSPGTLSESHSQMAALTALKFAFPFSTVAAVECAATGATEIQILVSTDNEAFRHAKQHHYETTAFRTMRAISKLSFLMSLLSFVCLFQSATINHGI